MRPSQLPEVDLPEVGVETHRRARDTMPAATHERRRGLASHEVHAAGGELRRGARHLRAPLGRELDVGAAEVADARLAVGLAVADEQDLAQGHGGSPTGAGRPGAARIGEGPGGVNRAAAQPSAEYR